MSSKRKEAKRIEWHSGTELWNVIVLRGVTNDRHESVTDLEKTSHQYGVVYWEGGQPLRFPWHKLGLQTGKPLARVQPESDK